jgi:hypothetical protein
MPETHPTGDVSRPPADQPDWRPLRDALSPTQQLRINRAHRRLDVTVRRTLADLHGAIPARRGHRRPKPTPEALAGIERLARMVGEIPFFA